MLSVIFATSTLTALSLQKIFYGTARCALYTLIGAYRGGAIGAPLGLSIGYCKGVRKFHQRNQKKQISQKMKYVSEQALVGSLIGFQDGAFYGFLAGGCAGMLLSMRH